MTKWTICRAIYDRQVDHPTLSDRPRVSSPPEDGNPSKFIHWLGSLLN